MSKAVAFLAGLGAGYVRGDEQRIQNELQAKRDAREQARFDADMADRKLATDNRDAIIAASQPVEVQPGTEFKPSQDMPVSTGDFRVGAQRFAEQGAANTAAADQNSIAGIRKRQMVAMARQGNALVADQLRTSGIQGDAAQMALDQAMKKVKDEGADRALAAALNGESPAAVEALYNAQGDKKVSNLKIEPYETTHPVLGKIKTARITGIDENGKPFELKDAQAARFNMFSAEKQLDAHFKAKEDARGDGQLKIAQQNANTASAAERAAAAYRTSMLNIEQSRLDMTKALHDAEAKVPFPVKQQFAQYEKLMNINASAIAKAQAEGNFDPTNKGVQELLLDQRTLMNKAETLLKPYLAATKSGGAPAADALGLYSGAAPAAKPAGWPANAPPGSTVRPSAATAAAAGIAPSAAVAPTTIQDEGLIGLSPMALAAVAGDPSNPRSAAARAMLLRMEQESRAATAATMAQPQYDPAMYGG